MHVIELRAVEARGGGLGRVVAVMMTPGLETAQAPLFYSDSKTAQKIVIVVLVVAAVAALVVEAVGGCAGGSCCRRRRRRGSARMECPGSI